MARKAQPHQTARELEILEVLWNHGPCSTGEVVELLDLGARRRPSHSAVATILGIMESKGFVSRDTSVRPFEYQAKVMREVVEEQFINHLTASVFNGSRLRLVARALDISPASLEDLDEIERLIREMRQADDNAE